MSSLIKKEDLEKAKNNELIIKETVEQIIKDFGLFSISIEFTGNKVKGYQDLYDQMVEQINSLLARDYEKLLSLLYQIDLSEKYLNKGNLPTQFASEAEYLSELIIQRELIKVLTRHYFKHNNLSSI